MKKRHFIFIATAILLVSCTTEKYYDEVEQQEFKSLSFNKRSYAEALEIANDAISMLGDDAVTRGGFPRKIDERHGVKYITNTITRSGTSDTLLYIFNYEGEEGYAVVSANKNTDGLLAVTESGSYDPSIGTDNPGLAMFMDMAEDYVVSAKILIIDGCNYYLRKSQDYVSSNGIDWEEYGEATYVTREYNHINWGWDGYNNGYFNDGVFCTYNYVSLDTSYSSDYAYNFNNRLNYFTVYH